MNRSDKIRVAVRHLISRGYIPVSLAERRQHKRNSHGVQSQLAAHFGVTRQRVSQIVRDETRAT